MNPRRGFASTPEPLPRFEGQENCTFTIRIPRVHLASVSREEITSRRAVWGTDIYTDDSDVIASCIHSGWIRGEWPKDVDVSLLGLVIDSLEDERSDGEINRPTKEPDAIKGKKKRFSKNRDIFLTKPPPSGPMPPPQEHDLHVTVLILPALEKYSSTTRWGIMSREWNSTHDGLSFMILNLRWVRGFDTVEEVNGKARKARMKLTLGGDVDEEVAWSSLLENGNGYAVGNENGGVKESFVRVEGVNGNRNENGAGKGPSREMRGLGMGSWWKEKEKRMESKTKSKSAEVQPVGETDNENTEEVDKEVEVKVEDRGADEVHADNTVMAS
jgi:Histone deacetylation protein Rxt3